MIKKTNLTKKTSPVKLPVVHAIKTLDDAKASIEAIRNFNDRMGKVNGLVFVDGKGNYTSKHIGRDIQPSGVVRTATTAIAVSDTEYLEFTIQNRRVRIPILIES